MIDVAGTRLDGEDREILKHPKVGGVILFSRNYEDPRQLQALIEDIHKQRNPQLLVAVDQEGGRVQRFRDGFTRLPPVRRLGDLYDKDPKTARMAAKATGWLMAAEMRAVGVDFSFAPVLDLDRGISEVIGDRGFHRLQEPVSDLAHHYMAGMGEAGMAATGKHFPGHGSVRADSHLALPVDNRSWDDIRSYDLQPFERMIRYGLAAMMPAHVIFPKIDAKPAGFSEIWLRRILRGELGFQGVIFSDDLNMAAADAGGGYGERANLAMQAGCDMILVCNNRPAAYEVLRELEVDDDPVASLRRARMHGRGHWNYEELQQNERWKRIRAWIDGHTEGDELELNF